MCNDAKGEITMLLKNRILLVTAILAVAMGVAGCTDDCPDDYTVQTDVTTECADATQVESSATVDTTAPTTDTDKQPEPDILASGKPYMGELNGEYVGDFTDSGETVSVVIFENEIKITDTPSASVYEGTLSYDASSGDMQFYLDYTYTNQNGTACRTWGSASGKLYEYDGYVYFICEASDVKALRDRNAVIRFVPGEEACTTVSYAEWAALEFPKYQRPNDRVFYMIRALLMGDSDRFADLCGVSPEVYSHMRGMKISSHRLYAEAIPAEDKPENVHTYAVLEFEVSESNSDIFPVGTHTLVFDEGLAIYFIPREKFKRYAESSGGNYTPTPAMRYVSAVGFEDFYAIKGEGRSQFGLCDFIVGRLNALSGDYKPHTAEEIKAYAEKYLSVDGDTLNIEWSLESVDGGYVRIGRGASSLIREYVSEETRDGLTVVTVRFFADYSATVTSRVVEFYLDFKDGEYIPVKTEIIEDNGFVTASLST